MKKYPYIKAAWLLFFVFIILSFYIFGWSEYFSLEFFQQNLSSFKSFYQSHFTQSLFLFVFIYVFVTTFNLPIATLLSLVGGALFGFSIASILVLFSSTVGATFSFLISRYLFKSFFESKFSSQLKVINKGIDEEGSYYLFALRLIPAFPFFLINILMGLTQFPVKKYIVISLLGMLPGVVVYVNAGSQLGEINMLTDIISPQLILSFVLIGILPLMSKKALNWIKKKNDF